MSPRSLATLPQGGEASEAATEAYAQANVSRQGMHKGETHSPPEACRGEILPASKAHKGDPEKVHNEKAHKGERGLTNQSMRPSAIAYLRVSTDEQKIGPTAQKDAIEAYAAREGIAILGWHLDQGVSGATPIVERPALQAALLSAREHRASLIVAKRDRIARDVMIATMVDRSLPKGCRVVSADGSGNGDAPADALMRTILDGMAEYERALIRSRTKAALQAKRSRGERAGNLPFGFVADASGHLIPHADEQRTIALARELASRGTGQRAIVRALAASGCVSRSGKPLGLSQVQRILRGT